MRVATTLGFLFLIVGYAQPAFSAILSSGDVSAILGGGDIVTVDPESWDFPTFTFIGKTTNGTMDITSGSLFSTVFAEIGEESASNGLVKVDGIGSLFNGDFLTVASSGVGTLVITNGGHASSKHDAVIGRLAGSIGKITVEGIGSELYNPDLTVANFGTGTLEIKKGGGVRTGESTIFIGRESGSTGEVLVEGIGSIFFSYSPLVIGNSGRGKLVITEGGLVRARSFNAAALTIDDDLNGDSFVNMSTGGMLALYGDVDDSLAQFFDLIAGTDAIRYWDISIADWAPITEATRDVDYTLEYLDSGDLTGHTVLTVGFIPEPSTLLLAAFASMVLIALRLGGRLGDTHLEPRI